MPRMNPVAVPNAVRGIEEIVVTHTKTKSGTITSSEKTVPIVLTKGKKSGQSSKPKKRLPANPQLPTPEPEGNIPEPEGNIPTEAPTEYAPTEYVGDTPFLGEQDYGLPDLIVESSRPQATVCAVSIYWTCLTDISQTPMEQWMQLRARYLHILLENEAKPISDKCSTCHRPAVIKCPDCFGSPSYCRDCVSDAHRCSPFHWPLLWTATHYTQVSLQSLGFFLCLGHGGAPCPKTVEVWVY